MSRLLLNLIFDKESRNHNEFESSFPPLHYLAHLEDLITPTWPLMAQIMHDDNTNALNAAILHISNGIVPFTNVEHAEKRHQDMHHELVMDASMMMESAAITTSMVTKMEILPENVDLHLFVCIYLTFQTFKSRTTFFLAFFIFSLSPNEPLLCFFLLPRLSTLLLVPQPTNLTHLPS
jgi:hypothetical protein